VKQVRIPTLLLAAIALLVVWYLTGGRNEIAWNEYVRNSKAQGWDLSQAGRWPHYGILYYVSAFGVLILLVVSGIRGIGMLVKKILKARGQ
jgi:hypothetical protein